MNSKDRVWGSVSGCPPKPQPGLEPRLHLVAGPRVSTWWLVLELPLPAMVCVWVCCLLLLYAHAYVQICVPVHAGTEATGRHQVSRSITLVRTPLRQGFFLNPKPGWQPEIPSNPPFFTSTALAFMWLITKVLGIQTQVLAQLVPQLPGPSTQVLEVSFLSDFFQ